MSLNQKTILHCAMYLSISTVFVWFSIFEWIRKWRLTFNLSKWRNNNQIYFHWISLWFEKEICHNYNVLKKNWIIRKTKQYLYKKRKKNMRCSCTWDRSEFLSQQSSLLELLPKVVVTVRFLLFHFFEKVIKIKFGRNLPNVMELKNENS